MTRPARLVLPTVLPAFAPALMLAACTQFPQLDAVEGRDVTEGDAPRLLPLQDLLDAPDPVVSPEIETAIAARVAGLRARADRLSRRAVIDAATKRRMARGVSAPE